MKFKKSFIALIITFKLLIFIFLAIQFQTNRSTQMSGLLFVSQGESSTYFSPVEHLIQGSGYSMSSYNKSDGSFSVKPSARRMPGILPIMLPLRLLLSKTIALDVYIIIQFILSVLATFFIGKIVFIYTSSKIASYITTLLFSVNSFTGVYEHMGITESLSISFSIFSIYIYLKATANKSASNKLIFLAGLLLTWSVFLRPAVVILVPIVMLELFFRLRNQNVKKILQTQAIFISVLLLTLVGWTSRNFNQFNKLIVFEDSVFDSMPHVYTPAEKALRPLINHWGGQRKKFYPNTMGAFFYDQTKDISMFPESIYNQIFTEDSLREFKTLFKAANISRADSLVQSKFIAEAKNLQNSFKESNPFRYHICAPLKSLLRFYFIKTENKLPFPAFSEMNLVQKGMKFMNILLYNLIALLGLITALIERKKWQSKILILTFPFAYCFALACILYNTEIRYLASVFPFLFILAAISLSKLIETQFFKDKLRLLKIY
jgi:hypothetical protein